MGVLSFPYLIFSVAFFFDFFVALWGSISSGLKNEMDGMVTAPHGPLDVMVIKNSLAAP
jgi:hypothetical protein